MGKVVSRRDSLGLLNESFPSFRQLDDVFLQTQARIWLGEVLKTRLEEDTSIGDLLADGVLLFSVSQVIWKMLMTKFMKLRSSNEFFCKSASGKNSGKYMPYSNIDSFLKICQILGLTGADLFCPSDVVEKKDTRRVCICIRSLSKKAISKNINVPDFDVVTCTVSMSKDMVEGICKSYLEQSQRRQSVDSSGSATYHNTRHIYRQKNWGAASARQYDSFSELSDDTDSYYTEDYHVCLLHSDLDSSPRRSSLAVENLHFAGDMFITDGQDDDHNELYSGSCSPSPEAKVSPSEYHRPNNNGRSSRVSYPIADPLLIGRVRRAINTLEDETLRTTKPINFQVSVDDNKPERNVICQLDTLNQDDCGSESDESAVYSEHGKKLFDEIDDDVSSTTFSDLEQEDMVDFVDKFVCNDAFSNLDVQIPEHLKIVERNISVDKSTMETDQLQIHINLEPGDSSKLLRTEICQSRIIISTEIRDPEGADDGFNVDSSLQASGNQLCVPAHPACENHEEVRSSSENFVKEETKHEQVGKANGASDRKRLRNKLLKSFAGGMSVLGVFLLFLKFRRPNDGMAGKRWTLFCRHLYKLRRKIQLLIYLAKVDQRVNILLAT